MWVKQPEYPVCELQLISLLLVMLRLRLEYFVGVLL